MLWLALRLMGVSIGLDAVIAVESLLYAVRSVAFAVPNAVGVQEGAYLVLGSIFGLMRRCCMGQALGEFLLTISCFRRRGRIPGVRNRAFG